MQPPAPNIALVESRLSTPLFTANFAREGKDSDALHWGQGELRLYTDTLVFEGKLAPGPDYRLYLTPEFVETEAAFLEIPRRGHNKKNFDSFVLSHSMAVNDGQ